MLIEEINRIDLESLERTLGDFPDVLWPAIQTNKRLAARGIKFEPELGGYNYLAAKRRERFTHQLFVLAWAIYFGRIKKCDAPFEGCTKKRDHLLFVWRQTVRNVHAHAAKTDGRNFQLTISKFALLHFKLPAKISLIVHLT